MFLRSLIGSYTGPSIRWSFGGNTSRLAAESQGDLQTKISDRITGLTAFVAMVGSTDRTVIEHDAGSTGISLEDGMEGTASRVIATQDAMVYGLMA